jgi:hypothetical protein
MDTFGREYERIIDLTGNRRIAESELSDRQERREKLDIHPLGSGACAGYLARWTQAQANFVDTPRSATTESHELVIEVMRARGYPVDNFEQRAADVSVDHPDVVENYRSAHAISMSSDPSTEELRQAMLNYRALFADLLQLEDEPRVVPTSVLDLREEERPLRYR